MELYNQLIALGLIDEASYWGNKNEYFCANPKPLRGKKLGKLKHRISFWDSMSSKYVYDDRDYPYNQRYKAERAMRDCENLIQFRAMKRGDLSLCLRLRVIDRESNGRAFQEMQFGFSPNFDRWANSIFFVIREPELLTKEESAHFIARLQEETKALAQSYTYDAFLGDCPRPLIVDKDFNVLHTDKNVWEKTIESLQKVSHLFENV